MIVDRVSTKSDEGRGYQARFKSLLLAFNIIVLAVLASYREGIEYQM